MATIPAGKAAMPRVSVVMAAYNAENFISRSIQSVLAQTGVVLELLVVDDASTDGTTRTVSELAQQDSRLRLLKLTRNSGPAVARNTGFAAATGDWIAVVDADDAYLENRLSTLITVADSQEADIVADNFLNFNLHTGERSAPALRSTPTSELLDLHRFVAGARPYAEDADYGLLKPIFRTSFLRANNVTYPENVRHGEDFELIVNALRAGARYVLYRAASFYVYTSRSSGWSRTKIDYSAQVQRSRAMAHQPDIVASPQLVNAFERRAAALERLQANRILQEKRARATTFERLLMDLRSPRRWRQIAKRVATRLRKP
jgi:succinoglycan biosynthesis protein ExoO